MPRVAGMLPQRIDGFGPVRPFAGAFAHLGLSTRAAVKRRSIRPGVGKVLPNLRTAIEACELGDGATISFHHHLRNGDAVLKLVLAELAGMGVRDIRIAASSLFPVHAPLVEHIRQRTVTGIVTSFVSGPVAAAIADGELATPAVMQTHGGRARALGGRRRRYRRGVRGGADGRCLR